MVVINTGEHTALSRAPHLAGLSLTLRDLGLAVESPFKVSKQSTDDKLALLGGETEAKGARPAEGMSEAEAELGFSHT